MTLSGAWHKLRDDPVLFTGKSNGQDVDQFPFPVDRPVLDRGQERFDIYCAPCHGLSGYGDGMIVQRGFLSPPSFHTDRLRAVSNAHIYAVMTHGYGAMHSYATRVPPDDRLAIVAYIRALQWSQHAPVAALDGADLARLDATAAGTAPEAPR
jgi:mono/diheme cytochrome c family protein